VGERERERKRERRRERKKEKEGAVKSSPPSSFSFLFPPPSSFL